MKNRVIKFVLLMHCVVSVQAAESLDMVASMLSSDDVAEAQRFQKFAAVDVFSRFTPFQKDVDIAQAYSSAHQEYLGVAPSNDFGKGLTILHAKFIARYSNPDKKIDRKLKHTVDRWFDWVQGNKKNAEKINEMYALLLSGREGGLIEYLETNVPSDYQSDTVPLFADAMDEECL